MGKDVRRERGEPGSGCQRIAELGKKMESRAPGQSSVPDKNEVDPVCHVSHINQQVEGCQDGHSWFLVQMHSVEGSSSLQLTSLDRWGCPPDSSLNW